jgi:protein-disulfide isomerase
MKWIRASLLIILLLSFPLSESWAAQERLSVPIGDSPVLGSAEAPVTIIEFMDFQ